MSESVSAMALIRSKAFVVPTVGKVNAGQSQPATAAALLVISLPRGALLAVSV